MAGRGILSGSHNAIHTSVVRVGKADTGCPRMTGYAQIPAHVPSCSCHAVGEPSDLGSEQGQVPWFFTNCSCSCSCNLYLEQGIRCCIKGDYTAATPGPGPGPSPAGLSLFAGIRSSQFVQILLRVQSKWHELYPLSAVAA